MNDRTIGEIILFAGNFIPRHFKECNGEILEVKDNPALFSVLGFTYGGDNDQTYALPNMTPPVGGMKYIICVEGIYPARN